MSQREILVELTTPKGRVFSGKASAVEFSLVKGVVQMEPGNVSYFGLIDAGEITLRIGSKYRYFTLVHASASAHERQLTILAEIIHPTIAPIRNCANPDCTCESGEVLKCWEI